MTPTLTATRSPLRSVKRTDPRHADSATPTALSPTRPQPGTAAPTASRIKPMNGTTDSNVATVSLTIVNHAPVATDAGYSTNKNTPLTVSAPGLLADCSDADGDSLYHTLSSPARPTARSRLNANGSFTYTSTTGYSGSDSFTSQGQLMARWTRTLPWFLHHRESRSHCYECQLLDEQEHPLTVSLPVSLPTAPTLMAIRFTTALVNGPAHGTLSLNRQRALSPTRPQPGTAAPTASRHKANDGSDGL